MKLHLVILLMLRSTTSITIFPDCDLAEDCLCTSMGPQTLLECPKSDPTLSIMFTSNDIQLHCRATDVNWTSVYSQPPQEEVKSFTISQCPPLDNYSDVAHKFMTNGPEELTINYSSFSTLTSKHFEHLSRLKSLDLSDNSIQGFSEDVFKPLRELTDLTLRNNVGMKLKRNIFQHLSKLQSLSLSQNGLENLPDLKALSELKTLYLGYNRIGKLDLRTFNNLRKLEALEVNNNQLYYLSREIFVNQKNLIYLNLSDNKDLRALPSNLFSNLTALKSLSLSGCNLQVLSGRLFTEPVLLQKLALQGNGLEELPGNIFKKLADLQDLDLSHNRLTDLPDEVFKTLGELKNLNLQNNMLSVIGDELFSSLENLEVINLGNNRIASITSWTFSKAESLRAVELAHNHLDIFKSAGSITPFDYNHNLEKVDFSHNKLAHVGDGWWSNIKLTELDLSYNQIKSLDMVIFSGMVGPLLLNISHNEIQTVYFQSMEMILKHFEKPQGDEKIVVDLNANPFKCNCYNHEFLRYLDGSMDETVRSTFAVLVDNVTCQDPQSLRGLPVTALKSHMVTCTPEELEIATTCPENCECMFRLWDKAFVVDCAGKNLTRVPKLILPKEDVFNQTLVYLQENFLTEGPYSGMGYENVTQLRLSSNNISEIAWVPSNVEMLALDNNNISHVSDELISMLNVSTLTNISLGNNPWSCNCASVNFTRFLVSQLINKHIDSNSIKCKNGELLVHLSAADLCPTYIALVLMIGIIFTVIISFLALCAAVFYRNQREIKVCLYSHNLCLRFVTEDELDKDKQYDAFISYCHKDETFVETQLIPALEADSYKLCIHVRNWVAGEAITEQIVKSVNASRRTIVVVSPNFLQSVWAKVEFRTAHTEAMAEGRARVIIVLYGDVDVADLDDELRAYVNTNTYVRWGDRWFWNQLKYALPQPQQRQVASEV